MDEMDFQIRLVVKAPNQQIDDQIIDCSITWTVKKLKTYLSEVYPNKPKAEDQKLIYSGQLLPDNLMLKDILRQYDTEVVHTVHLVCMPPKDYVEVKTPKASTSSSSEIPTSTVHSYNGEGLRQRTGTLPTNVNSEQRTDDNVNIRDRQTIAPNTFGLHVPLSPEQMNQQLAWMHMYGQYMNFYMQQYQGIYPVINPVAPTVQQPTDVPMAAEPVNQDNVQVRPINEIRRMNAQGGPADDDDEEGGGNRDWLDWVYVFSRLSVLFAIVYFYSSFNRLLMVMLFTILIYLYQAGVLRRRMEHRRLIVIPRPPPEENVQNDQNVNDQPPVAQDLEQMQRETRELEETMDRDNEANSAITQQAVSFLHIAWTFVATFFSSLLPQQPGAGHLN